MNHGITSVKNENEPKIMFLTVTFSVLYNVYTLKVINVAIIAK